MSDFSGYNPRVMAEQGTLDGDAGNGYFGPGSQDDAVGNMVISAVKGVISVLFAPAALVCFVIYAMFRKGRLKLSLVAGTAAVVTITGVLFFMTAKPIGNITQYVLENQFNPSDPKEWIIGLALAFLPLWIDIGLVCGPPIGVFMVWRQMRLIRKNPWIVLAEGEDYYQFRLRLTPLELMKKDETIKKIKADTLVPYGDNSLTPLGLEDEPMNIPDDPSKMKRWQVISRGEKEAPMHTLITGAAGAGKSKTMLSIMLRDIKRGNTVICIDNKNSPDLACSVAHMAKEYGRNFMHFSVTSPYPVKENPEGPCSYDPLAYGSIAKKTDMVLGMREWDTNAAVYREQAQSYLSVVFATIEEARKLGVLDKIPNLDTSQGELWTFMQVLDRNVFNSLVVAMNKFPEASYIRQQASDLNAKLSSSGRKNNEAQAAIHSQMSYQASFSGLMATYGDLLRRKQGGRMIDIMKASSEPNNVILFSLDASKQGDRGSELGALICQDLTNMTEMRPNLGQTNPVSVYIDEFQSLPPTCVASMLQKARASKVGLTLAFQSLDQVVAATDGKDAYVKGLLDTCSNFIFHAGSNYDTGEMAAKIIGKKEVTRWIVPRSKSMRWLNGWWTTNGAGVATQAVDQKWILDPSEFAKLSMPNAQNHWKSEAIIIKKVSSDPIDRGTKGAIAHKVMMIPPNEVLAEFYDPKEFIANGGSPESLANGSDTIDVPDEIMASGPVDGGSSTGAGITEQMTMAGGFNPSIAPANGPAPQTQSQAQLPTMGNPGFDAAPSPMANKANAGTSSSRTPQRPVGVAAPPRQSPARGPQRPHPILKPKAQNTSLPIPGFDDSDDFGFGDAAQQTTPSPYSSIDGYGRQNAERNPAGNGQGQRGMQPQGTQRPQRPNGVRQQPRPRVQQRQDNGFNLPSLDMSAEMGSMFDEEPLPAYGQQQQPPAQRHRMRRPGQQPQNTDNGAQGYPNQNTRSYNTQGQQPPACINIQSNAQNYGDNQYAQPQGRTSNGYHPQQWNPQGGQQSAGNAQNPNINGQDQGASNNQRRQLTPEQREAIARRRAEQARQQAAQRNAAQQHHQTPASPRRRGPQRPKGF